MRRVAAQRRESCKRGESLEIKNSVDLRIALATLEIDGKPLAIPDQAICAGHDSPFSYIEETFFERVKDSILIATRNGGKTLSFAALEFLEMLARGAESCHLGAIFPQAKRAYRYIEKWVAQRQEQIEKTTRQETRAKNGGQVEIITGTAKGVNSPHPHKSNIDEFELMEWDVFLEALSMAKSSRGIEAATRLATTRKYPSGNAQRMIEDADQRNVRLFKWCIFEVMTPCDCKNKEHGKCDEKYGKYRTYDREGNPVLWTEICEGKAKNCIGYYKFEDVLQKFLTLDYETFAAQWLCEKPERSESVFGEFHEDRNVIATLSSGVIQEYLNAGWQAGRGWDFGLDDPTVCLSFLWQEDGYIIQFDEYIQSGVLIEVIAEKIREKSDRITSPDSWEDWGDPSGKARTGVDGNSYISKLNELEIWVQTQLRKVPDGIADIKKALRSQAQTGKPKLYICANCTKTIKALSYAQWDRIETDKRKESNEKYKHDEHSHPLDALRYFVQGVGVGGQVEVG